jgi:hypothetical protein
MPMNGVEASQGCGEMATCTPCQIYGGAMSTVVEKPKEEASIRFSAASLELRDRFRDMLVEEFRKLASEHAIRQGRSVVDDSDFQAVLEQAMRNVFERVTRATPQCPEGQNSK